MGIPCNQKRERKLLRNAWDACVKFPHFSDKQEKIYVKYLPISSPCLRLIRLSTFHFSKAPPTLSVLSSTRLKWSVHICKGYKTLSAAKEYAVSISDNHIVLSM